MVEFSVESLGKLPGKTIVWGVGERIQSRLMETNLQSVKGFILPNSINAITRLVGQILIEMESQLEKGNQNQFFFLL